MDTSPERAFLAGIEERLAAGEQVEVEVPLSMLAGRDVEIDGDELRGALRRAVELLAAGGDPHRDLDPQGRAVIALASDLDDPSRRAVLRNGLAALRAPLAGLAHVTEHLSALQADEDAAWRWFSCTLLAEELDED
jgi:hypothetical protein